MDVDQIAADITATVRGLINARIGELNRLTRTLVRKSAGKWGAHPIRDAEEKLATFHAPTIQAGIRAFLSDAEIRAVVTAYLKESK